MASVLSGCGVGLSLDIWMAGEYDAESLWLCCNDFFQNDATLLSKCVGDGRL